MNGEKTKLPEELTLRDYFAAKAITMLIGSITTLRARDGIVRMTSAQCIAKEAYEVADAMLKERTVK